MVAKVIGSITMVISICFYVVFGMYVIYLQALSALGGSFGFSHFVLYLVCFALDTTTFFLMLSLIMSFCAMGREELLWAKDKERRHRLAARKRKEREMSAYPGELEEGAVDVYEEEYEYDGYGSYMAEDDDEPEPAPEPVAQPEPVSSEKPSESSDVVGAGFIPVQSPEPVSEEEPVGAEEPQ